MLLERNQLNTFNIIFVVSIFNRSTFYLSFSTHYQSLRTHVINILTHSILIDWHQLYLLWTADHKQFLGISFSVIAYSNECAFTISIFTQFELFIRVAPIHCLLVFRNYELVFSPTALNFPFDKLYPSSFLWTLYIKNISTVWAEDDLGFQVKNWL